eukprot:3858648-Ditylum_brightwellii.AAC.1
MNAENFNTSNKQCTDRSQLTRMEIAKKGITGLFFNPVPEKDNENNEEEKKVDVIDCSILELMKQRKSTHSDK